VQDAVEQILAGKFNNEAYALEFSSPVIELKLQEGENHEGSFFITGPENEVTEGRVSSTRLRMHCLTEQFSGVKEEISYFFDGYGMSQGDTLKGEFRIISNHGEYFVPYEVTVVTAPLASQLGDIKNLFHFTNLARTNWGEAVNLFFSPDFAHIFQGTDRAFYGVYRGLAGGERREQKVEEFLLEIKKKQKVEFFLESDQIRIDNPGGKPEGRVVVNRNGWGYSELSVEKEGDFILLEKEIIREEDFLGNSYRLPFYIAGEKLHGGKNYGIIRFRGAYACFEAKITVNNKSPKALEAGKRRQKKHAVMELMQYYEAFRTKKISSASWMKETGSLVEKMVSLEGEDVAARLFKVQLYITQEREREAEWLLNQIKETVEENFEPALYCYYLYLTTLLNRRESYIDEIAGQVERIFTQNSDNWRIAWLLLYLSGDYARSPSRKWLALEEQFRQGCKSPVLYIEAWNLVAANPALLMRLESFELQILTYGAKKELLTPEVIGQTVYLAQRVKNYSVRLFDILRTCYQLLPTEEGLQALCSLLIKGNKTDKSYFVWYEKGIEKELRITRLYEYYMMSLPLAREPEIPKIVLMYFAFDSSLDSLRNAYLYAYVHRNQGQYPELYESYREQIERFVVFQLLKGRSNRYLAYLYKNLITPVMLTEEIAGGLSTALFVRHLRLERGDIRKAVLIYEKENQEAVYPVMGKEAYLPVYGDDCRLLLEDGRGNRFCREEEYVLEKLLTPDRLAFQIAPFITGSIHFTLWLCESGGEIAPVSRENVEFMKRLTLTEEIREEVRKEIRIRLIQFFFDNDWLKELDQALEALLPEQIHNNCFSQALRFLIVRGMYEKAFAWIKMRGCEGVEAKIIVRLCSRLLSLESQEEDATMTKMAYLAFRAGKYDEKLLEYLCSHFRGTSKEMRDVWKAAEAFGTDTYGLSERILIQMLSTGAFVGERADIFKRYVSGGARTQVELAVLAQNAYEYFVKDRLIDEFVLEDLQRVIERQEEALPFVCKLAYTRYYAENKHQADQRVFPYLVVFLREILAENKYFPYFKEYAGRIGFMRQFMDKTMVEYRVREGNSAAIHYLLEKRGGQEGDYVKEEMQDMFGGICVKQFILFFGEHLQYYITETEDGKGHLTESGSCSRNDTGMEQSENRYNLLNDIAIGRNLHDYDTMEKLLKEYFEQDYLARELFSII